MDITGVILAGGRSRRFGSDKALAMLDGKVLIEHAKDILTEIFSHCMLVTNTPEQYAFLNMPMVKDSFPGMGPLAGIHAALRNSANPLIFVLGCDMPRVPSSLVTHLCNLAREEKFQAVVPWLKSGPEPLCGLYSKTALAAIEAQLQNGKPQARALLGKIRVRKVHAEEILEVTGDLNVFYNVNCLQDLKRLS